MIHLFAHESPEGLTETGENLSREVYDLLKPLVSQYIKAGYSVRDLELLILREVTSVCVETNVRIIMDKRRAK